MSVRLLSSFLIVYFSVAMVSFGQGLVEGIKAGYCSYFSALNNAADWMSRIGGLPVGNPLQDFGDAMFTWQCGPAYPPPQLPPPPFEGGQCPGVLYDVYAVRTRNNGNGPPSDPPCELINDGELLVADNLLGPISGVSTRTEQVTPTVAVEIWEINYGAGQVYNLGGFVTGCPGAGYSAFRVVRNDGLPDTCGNPPVPIPPVSPVDIEIDIDYDGGTVVNVPITIGPFYVDVGGNVYAPITVNLPDVELTGNLNITPEFSFAPEFNLNIGGVQPDPDSEPVPENPTGPGETDPENPPDEPDDDKRIIAVICAGRIESDARPTGIYQEVGPDIWAPRLATVRFGTVIGSSVFWSNDIPVKGLRSVIECPIPWGASMVILNSEPGVAMSYTPVRSIPPEWPPTLELGQNSLSDER